MKKFVKKRQKRKKRSQGVGRKIVSIIERPAEVNTPPPKLDAKTVADKIPLITIAIALIGLFSQLCNPELWKILESFLIMIMSL